MKPQTAALRSHLLRHGHVTGLTALRELGIYRCAARVGELREIGMDIETTYRTRNGKRWAKYVLRNSQPTKQ